MITRIFAVLLLLTVFGQPAWASDWRYCLAPSHAHHKVYLSQPFSMRTVVGDPEPEFGAMLTRAGVAHDDVQCPRGRDEARAEVMRRQAIHYNHEAGNTVVRLPWNP